MSDYSSPPLDLLLANQQKGYVGLHIQQGVPLLDRDLNLLHDLISATVRSVITRYIGNGTAAGADGFTIQALAAGSNTQNFNVSAGTAPPGTSLVGGLEVNIPADVTYNAQNTVPLTTPTAAQPNPRPDTVYLDVSLVELDGTTDPTLNNTQDIGIETSVRLKPAWIVRVAEAAAVPSAPVGHVFYPLAKLLRPLGIATIDATMITDLRQRRLTVSDLEARLRLVERLVVAPGFAATPNQFAPKIGAPGQIVSLNGRNFDLGGVSVLFGGVASTLSATPTATLITAVVPAGLPAGPVKVTVTTTGGSVVSDDSFNVLATPPLPPAPGFGPVGGQFGPKIGQLGQLVTLNGTNFDQPGLSVTIGGVNCVLLGAGTATQIQLTIPPLIPGAYTFSVTTKGGTVTSTDVFNVLVLPPILLAPAFAAPGGQFAPKIGSLNQAVTLNGTNFDQGGLIVALNGVVCALNGAVTSAQIPVKIPAVPPGSYKFTVTTTAGTVTSTDSFTAT